EPNSKNWTAERLINWILDQQNVDGGWSLIPGKQSTVDITAMTVTALANYPSWDKVNLAIDKALRWISQQQQPNGGFIDDQYDNAESAAYVIIALTALGIDPESEPFTKKEGSVYTHLLRFHN